MINKLKKSKKAHSCKWPDGAVVQTVMYSELCHLVCLITAKKKSLFCSLNTNNVEGKETFGYLVSDCYMRLNIQVMNSPMTVLFICTLLLNSL